jgi:membrane protein implicated in regulation of membrane protease activity
MMSDYAWILWVVLGLLLIIAEVFTSGFVLLWFGIGALVAALSSVLGVGYPLQFLVFFIVSIALTVASRTIFASHFVGRKHDEGGLKTGVESLPGKVGTVVTSSRGALNEGAVKVFGSTWTAYPSAGEEPLEAGDRVMVDSVQGASIYVRRFSDTPDWRAKELTERSESSKD